ncbi:MAG: hypothetical protein BWY06_03400 [Candidatus Latescibacteria bacterium ADurb.Bin168]|nr:MAG: hypothetical protein BWY06_03400 [Candidatus Latescibacteria bacterium ADurb.Bin168]
MRATESRSTSTAAKSTVSGPLAGGTIIVAESPTLPSAMEVAPLSESVLSVSEVLRNRVVFASAAQGVAMVADSSFMLILGRPSHPMSPSAFTVPDISMPEASLGSRERSTRNEPWVL